MRDLKTTLRELRNVANTATIGRWSREFCPGDLPVIRDCLDAGIYESEFLVIPNEAEGGSALWKSWRIEEFAEEEGGLLIEDALERLGKLDKKFADGAETLFIYVTENSSDVGMKWSITTTVFEQGDRARALGEILDAVETGPSEGDPDKMEE